MPEWVGLGALIESDWGLFRGVPVESALEPLVLQDSPASSATGTDESSMVTCPHKCYHSLC